MNGAQLVSTENGGALTATNGHTVGLEHTRPQLNQTLLKYDPPVRVAEAPPFAVTCMETKNGTKKQATLEKKTIATGKREVVDCEESLAELFPMMQWTEDSEEWVQCVSTAEANRMDVITLQEQLDLRCEQRHALPQGICPVREDLYEQCFDELVRQTTVDCAERGTLLAKMRDEIRMTIDAYQTMYDTSCQLGMRQALQLEKKHLLAKQLADLQEEASVRERQLAELKAKQDAIEKREIERRQADEQRHQQEVAFLKKTNTQLTNELKRYMA